MEKSRKGQEVNYKLMGDLEITARLFHLFGELIGMFSHALGRSGNIGKKLPTVQILKNWATGGVLWWLLPRQTGFSSETINSLAWDPKDGGPGKPHHYYVSKETPGKKKDLHPKSSSQN